jgi:hypothetical protein
MIACSISSANSAENASATANAVFRPIRLRSGQAPAGRKTRFISIVLAALPPEQWKKMVISMLPQANMPLRFEQTHQPRKSCQTTNELIVIEAAKPPR